MRLRLSALAGLLLCAAAFPGVAAAAAPARWPSPGDIRAHEPGIARNDAACIAGFFRGRIARGVWRAPYYAATPAQKRIISAGLARCMTRAERIAMRELDFTRVLGEHPELRCVAERLDARSWAVRLAVTSRLDELRMYDRVFRACGFMGVFYGLTARSLQLELAPSEERCVNRFGSVVPFSLPEAARTGGGAVFDRCVGAASETAMWRRVLRAHVPAKALPCAVRRLTRTITFAMVFAGKGAPLTRLGERALRACGVTAIAP
jgi:hypothetical protein